MHGDMFDFSDLLMSLPPEQRRKAIEADSFLKLCGYMAAAIIVIVYITCRYIVFIL